MKNMKVILAIVLAVIIGLVGYFFWYVPKTPVYTLKLIKTAVEAKEADTFFKHVDTASIVSNLVDREVAKDTSGFAAAFAPMAKSYGTNALNQAITSAFSSEDKGDIEKNNDLANIGESFMDLFKDDEKGNKVSVKDISSEENNGIATITISLENKATNKIIDLLII